MPSTVNTPVSIKTYIFTLLKSVCCCMQELNWTTYLVAGLLDCYSGHLRLHVQQRQPGKLWAQAARQAGKNRFFADKLVIVHKSCVLALAGLHLTDKLPTRHISSLLFCSVLLSQKQLLKSWKQATLCSSRQHIWFYPCKSDSTTCLESILRGSINSSSQAELVRFAFYLSEIKR